MLRWHNQWGKHLDAWTKLYTDGREPPRQFFERPLLDPDYWQYMTAFQELSTERQIGMGVGPIPASKIKAYAREEFGLLGTDDVDRFCAIIRRVDGDYVTKSNSTERKPSADPSADDDLPATDTAGVKQMFRRKQLLLKRDKKPTT